MNEKIKHLLLLPACFCLAVPTAWAQQANPLLPQYPFKTAIIHYKIDGKGGQDQGEGTLYIKGLNQVYREKTYNGRESMEIRTPEYVYNIRVTTGGQPESVAEKKNRDWGVIQKHWEALNADQKATVVKNVRTLNVEPGINLLTYINPTLLKEEKIKYLGLDAMETRMGDYRSVRLQGTDIELYGHKRTAVKIETNVNIPDSYFNVPGGIKVNDKTGTHAQEMNDEVLMENLDKFTDPGLPDSTAHLNASLSTIMERYKDNPEAFEKDFNDPRFQEQYKKIQADSQKMMDQVREGKAVRPIE